MKLRHPWLINVCGWLGAWLVRGWIGTLRYRFWCLGPNVDPHETNLAGRYIYAVWHENLLLTAYQYAQPDICVLISQHADGQLIARICQSLGFRLVRGSTTRGGVEALRQLLRTGREAHLAITPDGPRGPRRTVHQGLVYVAARTGMPIVPVGIGFDRPWRMKSWDRFAVPRPFSRATLVLAEPIAIPAGADRGQLEFFQQQVQLAMLSVNEVAQRWAETGTLDPIACPNSLVANIVNGNRVPWTPNCGPT